MPHIIWDHPEPFIYETSIKAEHIDDFQHTNNVVYLSFMAKATWEHSIVLGLDFEAYQRLNRGMIVRRHEMDYLAPSHLGDRILCATWITGNDQRLRLRRHFQLVSAASGVTLLRGMSEFVCIDIKSGRPKRMPPEFLTTYKLTAHIGDDA